MGLKVSKKKADKHVKRGKAAEKIISTKHWKKINIDKITKANDKVIFVGLDISIHSPGLAFIIHDQDNQEEYYSYHLVRTEHNDHVSRYIYMSHWIHYKINEFRSKCK